MKTGFLSEEEVAQVRSIMAAYGLHEFGASVRLWGRGKAIEVSGTLDKRELSCLLAISRYLSDDRLDGPQPASAKRSIPLAADAGADRLLQRLELERAPA